MDQIPLTPVTKQIWHKAAQLEYLARFLLNTGERAKQLMDKRGVPRMRRLVR
jgi:hypothetical protein